ncbi:hypothetical protein ACTFIZ_007329 [Dictyostelium cf. discoideum]
MGILDIGNNIDNIFDEFKKLSEIIQPPIKNSNKAIDLFKELAISSQRAVESTLKPYEEFGEQLKLYSSIILPLLVVFIFLAILCKLKELFTSSNIKNNKIKTN